MNLAEMLNSLRSEPIKTWFDLGLFIDRFREKRPVPAAVAPGSFEALCQDLQDGGIALISFNFDSAPVAQTAARVIRMISEQLNNVPLHAIGGETVEEASLIQQHRLPEVHAFDRWRFFRDFFHTRLERGGPKYNRLIGEFWAEVLDICQKLGTIIQAEGIQLLYLINANSLLGNVSFSLAIILLSEYLGIPVISHSLDFYWTQDLWLPNTHLGELLQTKVLFPWDSRSWLHLTPPQHAQELVEEKGLNPANVMVCKPKGFDFRDILYQLFLQLQPNDLAVTGRTVEQYRELCRRPLDKMLPTKDQHYLPGYGRTEFMLYLKSLIDPSYFRVEERELRGMVMSFAQELILSSRNPPSTETVHRFYNTVDNIFLYHRGTLATRHDHSFAYRHRNTIHYPYRDLTHQELTGLINQLFHKIVDPAERHEPVLSDWSPTAGKLALDDRHWLDERLAGNSNMVYFPGELNPTNLDYLILRPLRAKLNLRADQPITPGALMQPGQQFATVTVFCRRQSCGNRVTAQALRQYLLGESNPELSMLYQHGYLRIISTDQWCKGIHLAQLGLAALGALDAIRDLGSYLVSDDWEAAMMTDVMDIDRFHLGQAAHPLTAKMLGIPLNSDYVQFVPAGVRTTLAYPTPIQTSHDFSQALKSDTLAQLGREGTQQLFHRLRQESNCPVKTAFQNLLSDQENQSPVAVSHHCGLYQDGRPWSGVVAKIEMGQPESRWEFAIQSGNGGTRPVTEFAADFARQTQSEPALAWNGGFILNAELVGKLGLPESFIGSPLSLIISDGEVICPPLFNKPAFLIHPNGRLDIQRVNCAQGITVSDGRHHFTLGPAVRNPAQPPPDQVCFYDLMADQASLRGDGRVIVQLAANVIKAVTQTQAGQNHPRAPVGLTLSFPAALFPADWAEIGTTLQIKMLGWNKIRAAIGAGPLLVNDGQICIDLQTEGWYTSNSIRTQAARLDYTDMRGPKIAIGLGKRGNLSVVAINGRIRESVGATYQDMAEILVELGMQKAMGFDPGGSGTLVVNGKPVNISPYNANYEQDVYSLPPQPRAVGNAVIGYQELV